VPSPAPKSAPTFDLHSAGLALILESAIEALDELDFQERKRMIKSGAVSDRVKFVGIDGDFAEFEWGGKTLILVRTSILRRLDSQSSRSRRVRQMVTGQSDRDAFGAAQAEEIPPG
jgi:hypothetical protein